MYSCMDFAAFFPSPIARMTVASPLIASPPANTPEMLVMSLSSTTRGSVRIGF